MTLEDFLNEKISLPFTYEIESNILTLRFDFIEEGTVTAINIADNAELKLFSDLLDGRVINLVGNEVASGANVSVITIDKLTI